MSRMTQGHSALGFAGIAVLYIVIGLMTAAGTICISRKTFAPKAEQIFYAMFLILVAAFYLSFLAYFDATTAWRLETMAIFAFAAMALLGVRLPLALMIGYPLHGLWDLAHELQAHGAHPVFEPGQLTAIPLAYGIFCAAFDFSMAAYFYTRRVEWRDAWKAFPKHQRP
jgi:Family of unknown function (DUF6010)